MGVYGEVIVGEVSGGLKFFAAFGFGAVEYGCEPDGVGTDGSYMVEGGGDAGDITVFAVAVGSPHCGISRDGGRGVSVEGCHHDLVYGQ